MAKQWNCPKHPDYPTRSAGDVAICGAYRCTGAERGRRIAGTDHIASTEWPDQTFLQGGDRGLVVRRNPGPNEERTYFTAFVEVHDEIRGFVRGEGETVAEAEQQALEKSRKIQECPKVVETGDHEWEARGYTNGGGFCTGCNKFGSRVFTPEQLGLSCAVCDVPANYERVGDDTFVCEAHCPPSYHDVDAAWAYLSLSDHGGYALEDVADSLEAVEVIAHLADSFLPANYDWEAVPFEERYAAVKMARVAHVKKAREAFQRSKES